MKRTSFIAATGAAAALAGSAGTIAGAEQNQTSSNFTIRTSRGQVTGIIAELQTEQADYGGHRVNAINNYKTALAELNAALDMRGETPGQRASDYVLRQVQSETTTIVNSLDAAAEDYGGHRVKAINALKAANAELTAALNTA
jgi:hypothetical protein